MNTTEPGLYKKIAECVKDLTNYHNVPIVVGYMVGKQLRTMGSEHLRQVIIDLERFNKLQGGKGTKNASTFPKIR